ASRVLRQRPAGRAPARRCRGAAGPSRGSARRAGRTARGPRAPRWWRARWRRCRGSWRHSRRGA
ncbi:unnamed protein product, partial [Prorocentrum cordatum]